MAAQIAAGAPPALLARRRARARSRRTRARRRARGFDQAALLAARARAAAPALPVGRVPAPPRPGAAPARRRRGGGRAPAGRLEVARAGRRPPSARARRRRPHDRRHARRVRPRAARASGARDGPRTLDLTCAHAEGLDERPSPRVYDPGRTEARPHHDRKEGSPMQIEVKGRNTPVTDELREHVEKRFAQGREAGLRARRARGRAHARSATRAIADVAGRRGDAVPQGRDAARPRRLAATWTTRSTSARTSSRARSSATATSAASAASHAPPQRPPGRRRSRDRRRRARARGHGSRCRLPARCYAGRMSHPRSRAARGRGASSSSTYEKRVARINDFEPELELDSDEELRERADALRERAARRRAARRPAARVPSRSCARPASARWACATSTCS